MSAIAARIDWVYLDQAADVAVAAGDLVSAEAGGMPIYRVLSVADGRARLRELGDGADRVAPLGDLHWKARASEA